MLLGVGDRDGEYTEVVLLTRDMSVSDVPVHKLRGEECCTFPNALSSHILSAAEEEELNSIFTA